MRKYGKKRIGDAVVGSLLALCIAVFLISGWKLMKARQEYTAGSEVYEELVQTAVTPAGVETTPVKDLPATEMPEEQPQSEELPYIPLLEVDFAALQAINPRTVAWLRSPSGEIDYPVVQGDDNSYYLSHLIDGTENRNGSIFIDYRNEPDFSDRNTFIYGHNMENDTMFADLVLYGTEGYYEANPELILVTPEASYYLQIFSGYVADPESDTYKILYRSNALFLDYVEAVRAQSVFETDVEITTEDKLVTLSTCSTAYEDARFVLHCKLVKVGEREKT